MRKPRVRTVLIATGAAVALMAGSTAAYAAIAGPTDGTGVIHGCYTNKALNGSHVVVLQDAGTNCPAGTTAISWNQLGQAGPTGPAGAPGPAGATGPAGPSGVTGPPGPPGTNGTAGTNGTNILTSQGAPAGTCTPGDSDVELGSGPSGNGEVWTCSPGATWNDTGSSIEGPTGPLGPQGPPGASGPDCSAPGPGANLALCQFLGSSALAGINLAGANLTGANLAAADLAGANLAGANLTGANLAEADLTGANLAGADLAGAILTDAILTDALAYGTNFTLAHLSGVTLSAPPSFGWDTWGHTICPDGTNSDNDFGTCASNL